MELAGPKIHSAEATELMWRVSPGQFVSVKQVLGTLTYETPFTGILAEVKGPLARDTKQFPVKAGCSGKVIHLAQLDEYRETGALGAIHPCLHEQSFGGLCAQCGLSLEKLDQELKEAPHVDFGIASTGFKVQAKAAKEMEFQRSSALREQRRLVLILDLDQTVLHTVSGRMDGEEVHYFTQGNFSTFLRPHLNSFLEQLKELYEIYVYTMGTRPYAELMCGLIDPQHTFFRQRIISK